MAKKKKTIDWQNRIVEHGEMPADQFLAHELNARRHPGQQREALRGSLNAVGWIAPVIVSKRTGKLLDGHARIEEALTKDEAGLVPFVSVDVDEAQEALILGTFDPITNQATYDREALDGLLRQIETSESGLQQLLADLAAANGIGQEVSAAAGGEPADAEPQIDRAAELNQKWKVERGQLWLIGEHRLLCGDSTKDEDVARVMNGEKAALCFTSPPYASQRKYDEASDFEPIQPNGYAQWWMAVQANIKQSLAEDGSFCLNIKEHCEAGERHLYVKELVIKHVKEWQWRYVDELCWRNTKNGVPGTWPNRFKNAFEPVFHFAKQAEIKFRPVQAGHQSEGVFDYHPLNSDSTTGTPFTGAHKHLGYKEGVALPSNVIEVAAEGAGLHSAPFPVGLPSFFIKAFTDAGDSLYEPFCGSGTTMAAAQNLNRKCYAMEISPNYCAVILERMATAFPSLDIRRGG